MSQSLAEGYDWADETSWGEPPVSYSDRRHQSANTQNAHHPFHIVRQSVERHFGSYVLESFPCWGNSSLYSAARRVVATLGAHSSRRSTAATFYLECCRHFRAAGGLVLNLLIPISLFAARAAAAA